MRGTGAKVLLLSHYTRASRMPEKVARIVNRGLQGRGFKSHKRAFVFFILNLAIMSCNEWCSIVTMGLFCACWNLFNCNMADFIEWWLVISLQNNSTWQKEELYKKNCHVYITLKSPSTKDLKLKNPSSTQFVSPLKIVNLKSNQARTGWGSGDIHYLNSILGDTLNT